MGTEPDELGGSLSGQSPRGMWRAKWIAPQEGDGGRGVFAYRLAFDAAGPERVPVYVTADERYDLWCDGVFVGRGPERGDRQHWYYARYEMDLTAGPHVLVARVWSLGNAAPYAQISLGHGFLLAATGAWHEKLATGAAPWQAQQLPGLTPLKPAGGTGCRERWDGSKIVWGWRGGAGEWRPVKVGRNGKSRAVHGVFELSERWLTPGEHRPHRKDWTRFAVRHVDASASPETDPCSPGARLAGETAEWAKVCSSGAVTVAANTARRVIIDLCDYVCGYPRFTAHGGAGGLVTLGWAEALHGTADPAVNGKENRDRVDGLYFKCRPFAVPDEFLPDGGRDRDFGTLWWRCGRYLQLTVATRDEPLTIQGLSIEETRAEFEDEGRFGCDNPAYERMWPICVRSLQVNAHETYMDCPYYEQQQWVGDARVQALCGYVLQADARIQRKAVELIAGSLTTTGFTSAMWPVRQDNCIPSFALGWIGMVADYARWRGDRLFIRGLLPTARTVLDFMLRHCDCDGLVKATPGWQYLDWVKGWEGNVPPGSVPGPSAPLNLFLLDIIDEVSRLEEWAGETEYAARWNREADKLAGACMRRFWDAGVGALADDPGHTAFSEHSQVLAVLSGRFIGGTVLAIRNALRGKNDFARCSYFFSHYLLEAYGRLGLSGRLLESVAPWLEMPGLGFRTTPETAEPSRSDAHGWSAHPLFHFRATVAGIRPGDWGFATVAVRPLPGALNSIDAAVPHPAGTIEVRLKREGLRYRGTVKLPDGIGGVYVEPTCGQTVPLRGGEQKV